MNDFLVIPTLLAKTTNLQLSFAEIEAQMNHNHMLPELAKTYSAWWTKKNILFQVHGLPMVIKLIKSI